MVLLEKSLKKNARFQRREYEIKGVFDSLYLSAPNIGQFVWYDKIKPSLNCQSEVVIFWVKTEKNPKFTLTNVAFFSKKECENTIWKERI